mmetsp:Transcript_120188/g.345486  ORF Transcript_120188/g.345486 Transcript_120188/m.345486 type:complete len:253 (-) Transcript_120188:124-882(-)
MYPASRHDALPATPLPPPLQTPSLPRSPQVDGVLRPFTTSSRLTSGRVGEDRLLGTGASSRAALTRSGLASTAASLPHTGLSQERNATSSTSRICSRQVAMRNKILESVTREQESALADCQSRLSKQALSAMDDYLRAQEDAKQRQRAKQLSMPLHLRTGTSATDMGCPVEYLTQTARAANLPIKMAVEPKWSTELKRINDKVGQRIEYERMISAAVPGSISPELPFMHPKKHLSNPPTPYMEPGNLPRQRK